MLNPEHLRSAEPEKPVVLLVDDDVTVLNVARITLEDHGYFVLTADNGEAGLYLSRQYPGKIDVLLTDVKMPKMSGTALSKHISVERPTTRIVLMSGNVFGEDINPRFPFLEKPFGLGQLAEIVNGLARHRRTPKG